MPLEGRSSIGGLVVVLGAHVSQPPVLPPVQAIEHGLGTVPDPGKGAVEGSGSSRPSPPPPHGPVLPDLVPEGWTDQGGQGRGQGGQDHRGHQQVRARGRGAPAAAPLPLPSRGGARGRSQQQEGRDGEDAGQSRRYRQGPPGRVRGGQGQGQDPGQERGRSSGRPRRGQEGPGQDGQDVPVPAFAFASASGGGRHRTEHPQGRGRNHRRSPTVRCSPGPSCRGIEGSEIAAAPLRVEIAKGSSGAKVPNGAKVAHGAIGPDHPDEVAPEAGPERQDERSRGEERRRQGREAVPPHGPGAGLRHFHPLSSLLSLRGWICPKRTPGHFLWVPLSRCLFSEGGERNLCLCLSLSLSLSLFTWPCAVWSQALIGTPGGRGGDEYSAASAGQPSLCWWGGGGGKLAASLVGTHMHRGARGGDFSGRKGQEERGLCRGGGGGGGSKLTRAPPRAGLPAPLSGLKPRASPPRGCGGGAGRGGLGKSVFWGRAGRARDFGFRRNLLRLVARTTPTLESMHTVL